MTKTVIVYETDSEGHYILDENGDKKPVYETDANGNYILDADGNKIPKRAIVYKTDSAGNYIFDDHGDMIPEKEIEPIEAEPDLQQRPSDTDFWSSLFDLP